MRGTGFLKMTTSDDRVYIGKILSLECDDGKAYRIKVTQISRNGVDFNILSYRRWYHVVYDGIKKNLLLSKRG